MNLPESPFFKNSLAGASGLVLMLIPTIPSPPHSYWPEYRASSVAGLPGTSENTQQDKISDQKINHRYYGTIYSDYNQKHVLTCIKNAMGIILR